MRDVLDERTVAIADRLPVESVHTRVVEVIARDAPRLVVDLQPLRAQIHPRHEVVGGQRAVAREVLLVGRDDPDRAVAPVEHTAAVLRDCERFVDVTDHEVGFRGTEREAADADRGVFQLVGRLIADRVQHAPTGASHLHHITRGDWQLDDALHESGQIDAQRSPGCARHAHPGRDLVTGER